MNSQPQRAQRQPENIRVKAEKLEQAVASLNAAQRALQGVDITANCHRHLEEVTRYVEFLHQITVNELRRLYAQ